jgi:hypothetical protein
MKAGLPNATRQNQVNAGFNLPLPINQPIYSNLSGAALDWDMIEADLGARLDWNGVVEVQAPTGLARGFYLNSKFNSGMVSSGGELNPCDSQSMRVMANQHGARLNIFALSANLVRLSIASSGWKIVREGRAIDQFIGWANELEANRGTGALEISVLSGRRGILAFESGERTLTAFQALTSLSFDDTALEWLNALASRPDARVRWFSASESISIGSSQDTSEVLPVEARVAVKPTWQPVTLPGAEVQAIAPRVVQPNPSEAEDQVLLELSDEISVSREASGRALQSPLMPVAAVAPVELPVSVLDPVSVQPVAQVQEQVRVQDVISPAPEVAPMVVQPVTGTPVQTSALAQFPAPSPAPTPAQVASTLSTQVSMPVPTKPSEITWPMLNAAWSELLAFTERRTDAARGAETFDRTWRESCIALAEQYPELDPFFADVKYANGTLIVRTPNAHLLEALLAAYQRSLASLGIPVQALEALVQPIRARHQAAWAATGLEALWRR